MRVCVCVCVCVCVRVRVRVRVCVCAQVHKPSKLPFICSSLKWHLQTHVNHTIDQYTRC